jgi:hypothetical protein
MVGHELITSRGDDADTGGMVAQHGTKLFRVVCLIGSVEQL